MLGILIIFLCNSIRLSFKLQKPMEEIKHEFILFILTPDERTKIEVYDDNLYKKNYNMNNHVILGV